MVWKKASEQLPKQSCKVVVYTGSWITDTWYSDRLKLFNAFDSDKSGKHAIQALYWAYPEDILPEGCHV